MPRNVYFSQGSIPEQQMFEDIMIESLKIYGQETYYLPRKIITRDMILNEDRESQFDDAYMIEMYIEDIEGFGGEGNLMSKFGIEIRDEVTFIVARRSWNKLVGTWNNTVDNFRPNEGDLIYLPLSGSLFEISFVEHEQPFYQLKNLPTYKLQCRLFEYNQEDFRTGIPDLDDIEKIHANVLSMLIRDITGEIELGKRYYQVTPNAEFTALDARKAALPGLISSKQSQIEVLNAELVTLNTNIAETQGQLATDRFTMSQLQSQLNSLTSALSSLQSQLASTSPSDPIYPQLLNQINSLNTDIFRLNDDIVVLQAAIATYEANLVDYNTYKPALQARIDTANNELVELQDEFAGIDTELNALVDTLPYVSGIIVEQDQVGGSSANRTIYMTDIESSITEVKDFYVSTDGVTYTYITDSIETPTVTARIYEIYDYEDATDRTFENDDAAQNYDFEKEADSIIDFSEKNPFGEPS